MTTRPLTLVLALLATSACARIGADSVDAGLRTADSLVASWVDTGRIPGAVLLVSKDGRTVMDKAYGWAQLYGYGNGQYEDWPGGSGGPGTRGSARRRRRHGAAGPENPVGPTAKDTTAHPGIRRLADPVPMSTATVFDMASVTKVMATTFAVMMLVDERKLELDAPLRTYLTDFRGGAKDHITLRMLLTHRAGLYQWQPVFYHAASEREAYVYIRDLPLAWEPGAERHYSDLGFMLLGMVVERVSGQPLDAFVRDRLYRPLGLKHTGFLRKGTQGGAGASGSSGDGLAGASDRAPSNRAAVVGRSTVSAAAGPFAATSHGNPYEFRMVHDTTFGYRYAGDPDAWSGWRHYTLVGEVNDGNAYYAFGGVAGHAGLFSTAGDLNVLLQVLLNEGEYGGRRYLSPQVIDTFMTPTGDGQALGWQVPAHAPAGSFDHTGFTGTYVLGVPARRLAVVLLTNRQNVGVDALTHYPDVGPLRQAVADALLRRPPSSSR